MRKGDPNWIWNRQISAPAIRRRLRHAKPASIRALLTYVAIVTLALAAALWRDCVLYAVLRGEWPSGGDGASSAGRANS